MVKTKEIARQKLFTVLDSHFTLGVRPEKENSNAVLSLRHLSLWLKAKGPELLTLTLYLVHTLSAKKKKGRNAFDYHSRLYGRCQGTAFFPVNWPAEGMAILPLDVWLYRSRQSPHLQATSKHLRISCDGAGRKALNQGLIDPDFRRRPPWDMGRFADMREVNIAETEKAEIQRKPIRRRCAQ